MKHILITMTFITAFLVSHCQQHPPPKNPKDPDADMIPLPKTDTATPIKMYSTITNPHGIDTLHIYQVVAQEPSFPGWPQKWLEYIKKNLKYPEYAKANNV